MAAAAGRLRELYARCGCLRVPIERRLRGEDRQVYKHGYELRIGARNRPELSEIQSLLQVLGVDAGRPYLKHGCPIVPIYGRERVLQVIRDLRLTRSLGRSRSRPFVPRMKAPARFAFTTQRQLVVALRMYDRGPLTAREVSTTPALLAEMERQRLVRPVLGRRGEKAWVLTLRGKEHARYGRVARLSRLRSGKRTVS
jgi:hypothetical protein